MPNTPKKLTGFAVSGDAKEKGAIGGRKSKGRVVSEETKRRLSESQKARYAKIKRALAAYKENE